MEQFIGCDAHKKFSLFVAVNEKGHAGEALRVTHDRQLYREFLARLPAHSAIAVEATGSYGWWWMRWNGWVIVPSCAIRTKPSGAWAKPTRPTNWMRKGWRSCCATTLPEVWIPPGEFRDQRASTGNRSLRGRSSTGTRRSASPPV